MQHANTKLTALGARLRAERLRRDETQAIFAARIGVSVPTLRKMEAGESSVMIGAWVTALEIVDRSDDWDGLLREEEDLFEKFDRLNAAPKRLRASRRHK